MKSKLSLALPQPQLRDAFLQQKKGKSKFEISVAFDSNFFKNRDPKQGLGDLSREKNLGAIENQKMPLMLSFLFLDPNSAARRVVLVCDCGR